ncbi:MAG: NAD-dependent epimerase/dehydratase family protein [Ferruginibacter sp.]
MKILVTGAAGFIAFHVIKKLLEKKHIVVGVDNLNEYYDPQLKISRLKELGIIVDIHDDMVNRFEKDDFIFYRMDITNKEILEEIFVQHSFDTVINLAAQAGVRYSLQNPAAYINSNIIGFFNIMECVRKFRPKHFIFASSSSVYGNNKVPFDVTDNTDNPVSLYAATKKSNEVMAYSYSHLYKIKTTGLRFFTVYGPWGRPDMAYFSFTKAILKGKQIQLFNNGHLYRDFTYIDDIVGGIIAVAEYTNGSSTIQVPYKIYNIGNHKSVQLLEFVKVLEMLLQKKASIKLSPMQPGDVYSTYADISELEKDYGFSPSTDLEEGLKEFVKWYQSYYV